jgi:hypothetical protein
MIIQCITHKVGATLWVYAKQHLLQGIHTDAECNFKSIDIMKYIKLRYRLLHSDKQISDHIGHYLQYESNSGLDNVPLAFI